MRELIAACDVAARIWNLITAHYSTAVQIVDWYHAADRVQRVAHAAFSQPEPRERWRDQMMTDSRKARQ